MTDYLVDNSIWGRLASADEAITQRVRRIERAPSDLLVTCPPQMLEFCHSARSPREYVQYRHIISMGFPLEQAPSDNLVLDIQGALWASGRVRAAGAMEILIAGYAIVNGATVLTADHDFDHIAAVSDLQHEYVQPST